MDGFNTGGMNLNKKPAGNMQGQMNNQMNNQYYQGEAPADGNGFNNQYQQNNFNDTMNGQQGPQRFSNGQNANGGYTGGDAEFTPYVNDTNYQNQSYTKSYQKAVKNKTYRNELNVNGAHNFNLMTYVILAVGLFMADQVLGLLVLFTLAFMLEKNTKLNQVIVTALITLLGMHIVYDAVYLLLQPLNSLFSGICNKADYGSFIYTLSYGLIGILSAVRNIVSWVYNVGLIGLGVFTYIRVDRGLFRVPKIISKYLN